MGTSQSLYNWKVQPRIITYTNPKKINTNLELSKLLKENLQLCASDTLMQGLISKYGRDSFCVMSSIENFQNILFDYEITGAKDSLQLFLDVRDQIDQIPDNIENKSKDLKNTLYKNTSEIVSAFKLLTLMQYPVPKKMDFNDAQKIFFEHIYTKLGPGYIEKYKQIVNSVTDEKLVAAYKTALCREVAYFLREDGKDNISDLNVAKEKLESFECIGFKQRKHQSALLREIDEMESLKIEKVIIHGVARFTPEIMMLIQVLDNLGKQVIFTFNYATNLKELYSIWEHAYSWVNCKFENQKSLELSSGRPAGRAIADISLGKRPNEKNTGIYRKYISLTDFTDGEVRPVFIDAQRESKNHPLPNMKIQYYSTDASKPNDILRNYFPEQFFEKPFMAYPVGQFIRSLFDMWDFDNPRIIIDFGKLKDCSQIKIAHNADNMFSILNKLEVYFSDIETVEQFNERVDNLIDNISTFTQKKDAAIEYLSFFDVKKQDVIAVKNFVNELENIGRKVFGSQEMQQVDYQAKFKELIIEVSKRLNDNEINRDKEKQLLEMLENSLSVSDEVTGSIKSLQEALMLYLHVKEQRADARWIVRGFDQLDGAPLMSNTNVYGYELTGLSMRKMSGSVDDSLPWPLTESLFHYDDINNLFIHQVKTAYEDRNDYLKFYLFYAAFFVEKEIKFSYFENENDEKNRPFYLLSMLGLIPYERSESIDANQYKIKDTAITPINSDSYSSREINIFSICPYKYFINSILNNKIVYSSDYHIKYFIETELNRQVCMASKYDMRNISRVLLTYVEKLSKIYPFFDEAALSDIKKFVKEHASEKVEDSSYIQKKRDFLIAKWDEDGKRYMNYTKTTKDIRDYENSQSIMPAINDFPHKKICQECCYNDVCLNGYYEKEVEL